MGPRLDNLEATLASLTQAHANDLGLVHGDQNTNAALLNGHVLNQAVAHQQAMAQSTLGYVPPTYTTNAAQTTRNPLLTYAPASLRVPPTAQAEAERRIRALEERLRGIAESLPDSDAHEEDSLLDDYERRFCIEGDYADDDEEHPVGSALVRMQAALADPNERPLVTHSLSCPMCRREYGSVMVPKGVAITYDVRCRGCELEGRK